jgi:hypothetical protein
MSTATARKASGWKDSEAKKVLKKDIIDGVVKSTDRPIDVWNSRDIYKAYPKSNFATNLRNLRKAIAKSQSRAEEDAAAVANDLRIHPVALETRRGYPRWNGSSAERLLKLDMDEGKHQQMTTAELRATRPAFLLFPAKVFSDHVQQELRRRVERPYWQGYHEQRA